MFIIISKRECISLNFKHATVNVETETEADKGIELVVFSKRRSSNPLTGIAVCEHGRNNSRSR